MSIFRAVRIALLALLSMASSTQAEPGADASFLRKVAQQRLVEVAACKLALVKARSPAVKSFADAVLADQARLHDRLQALARDAQVQLPVGLTLRQRLELRVLRDGSDDRFDQRFAETFGVKAYQRTIRLFESAAGAARDPDVQAFAQAALPWLRERLDAAKALSAEEDDDASALGWIGR